MFLTMFFETQNIVHVYDESKDVNHPPLMVMGNTCDCQTELATLLAVKVVVVREAQHQQVSRGMLLIISGRKLIAYMRDNL